MLPLFVIEMHNVYLHFDLNQDVELVYFLVKCIKSYYFGDLDRAYILLEGRYKSLFKADLSVDQRRSLLVARNILYEGLC